MSDVARQYWELLHRGPSIPYITEQHISGLHPIAMMHADQPAGDYSEEPCDDMVLSQIVRADAVVDLDLGAGRSRACGRRGDFVLSPRGGAVTILTDGRTEIRCFQFPYASMRDFLAEDGRDFSGDLGRLHAGPFRDPQLDVAVNRLWDEAKTHTAYAALAIEAQLMSITVRLMRLRDDAEAKTEPDQRRLDESTLKRIEAFVEERLETGLTGTELAGLCGMSRFQFARSFKATTGQTPHAYLLERRITRARHLLETGALPLSEIAFACGFSSQSHMTDVFRQKLGVTPGRYRKERFA